MRRRLPLSAHAMALGLTVALSPCASALEVNCSNGLDDDGDFLTDCSDPDCSLARDPACVVTATRNLDVVRDDPADPATSWWNIYLISWPELHGIGDIAGTSTTRNKCVGDSDSDAVPDGIVDSTDALCHIWHAAPRTRTDAIVLERFNRAFCMYEAHSITNGFLGMTFAGSPFSLDSVDGLWVAVDTNGPPPSRPVELRGWNDRSWVGETIAAPSPACHPSTILLHLPFDMMYRTATEILCGLRDIDWLDADGDGSPDTCPGGIFDGSTPISVETLDNAPGSAPTGSSRTDKLPVARAVLATDLGLQFLGVDFVVGPGDAVIVQIRDEHATTLFRPPRW